MSDLPPVINNETDRSKMFLGKGHTGLSNLGNTCFMNTILQCLSKTYEFTEFMLCAEEEGDTDKEYMKHLIRKGVDIKPIGRVYNCSELEKRQKNLVRNWEKLLYAMYDVPRGALLAPRTLHQELCGRDGLSLMMGRTEFVGYGQKDAEEFYGFLMEQMHLGLSYDVNITITGRPKNTFDKMAIDAIKSWGNYFEKEYSKILDLFYGQEYSLLICPDCGYESGTYQPMNRVHLPIPIKEGSVDLYDCFKLYNEGETLDSKNMWRCDGCNKGVEAKKCISVWSKPRHLVIHLKRFNKSSRKVNKLVEFPIYNLDIDDYCVGYGVDGVKYDLYAIANHRGGTGGGHYYAYCKDYDGCWREYNDTNISLLCESDASEETIKSRLTNESAYLLFYKRKD